VRLLLERIEFRHGSPFADKKMKKI